MEEWHILTAALFLLCWWGERRKCQRGTFLHLSDTQDSIPREQVVLRAGRGQRKTTNQSQSYKSGYADRRVRRDRWMASAPPRARTRAPGSHRRQRQLGSLPAANRRAESPPPPPRRPPTAVSHPNKPDHPKTKQTPPGASPTVPVTSRLPTRPRARLGHFAPRAGAPKRGRGTGARKHRDGNVKSLTNSS